MRELVSAVRRRSFLLCIGRTIVVSMEGSWYTPVRPQVLANFKGRGTADLLGSSSGMRPLVAEEKGVRAVRCLIKNSKRLLIDHISTAILCCAVLSDTHRYYGGEIVDRDRDTPQ